MLPATTRIGFPSARQVMKLTRGRVTKDQATGEVVYVVTSLSAKLAISMMRLIGHAEFSPALRAYGRRPELAAELVGL